jgi:type I restriction enzyme S subunit
MREGWTETTLGDIAELISRGRAPSYCEEDGVVVLNQKCVRNGRIYFEFARLTDITKKAIPEWAYLRPGDTLINSTGVGTLGRASLVSQLYGPTTFDSHVTLVRPRTDSCMSSFVGLSLNFREKEIEMFAGGSTGQTELSREAVYSFPVTLPPIAEQKRIVDVVCSVDAYIDALQQQVDAARTARDAVLHELLTAVGDDWTETTLGEITEVIMGRQLSPSKKMGVRPKPYLRAANIGNWGINLDDVLEMDFTESEERQFASQIGDVLLVEGGNEKSVGCPALVSELHEGLCIQNTIIRCRVKDVTQLTPNFLYHSLRHSFWLGKFGELCAGTTIMHLGQKRAVVFPFNVPPIAVQERIVEIVSSMDDVIQSAERAVVEAKNLRSGLLSDLLSGEHEIPVSYDELLGAA